jgi:uncharacterized membrane protein YfhO
MFKKILNFIVFVALIGLAAFLMFQVFVHGLEKDSLRFCKNLETQSQEGYVDFYVTASEYQFCADQGIYINAPIK